LIDDDERQRVARVFDNGTLSGFIATPGDHHLGGPEVRGLEGDWCALGSYDDVVAVNSATAGLHCAMAALHLSAGAEVIVPPYTMSATVAAVVMVGATPRFADVDPDLFTLTAETIEPYLSDRTEAIVPVHLFGQMAPMDGIARLAARRGLALVEDAAQAPGASQDGRWPGARSAGAVFSLNQHKTITCGEGGLLATNDNGVATVARLLRNHAESVVQAYPDVDPGGLVGWNYRLTEVEAAIGRAQTAKLDHLTSHRTSLADRLRAGFAGVPGLEPPRVHAGNTHVYFTFAVKFDGSVWGCGRHQLVEALRAEGVPCSAGYVEPLYGLPLFTTRPDPLYAPERFPTCERLATDELVLLHVCAWPAEDADIDDVVEALEKCWAERAALGTVAVSRSA
jgi:dTDP-4-amino-4,6-dideoxygalactose transaminase